MLHVAPSPGASRFGVALTRRMVPLAVARNRLKRVAREVFRRHAAKGARLDLVLMLRVRPAAEEAFAQELAQLLDQATRA